jgi:hypothetical protein
MLHQLRAIVSPLNAPRTAVSFYELLGHSRLLSYRADCGGDTRAAVGELLAIIRSLIHENQMLREAASPGFARRRPIIFGQSKK